MGRLFVVLVTLTNRKSGWDARLEAWQVLPWPVNVVGALGPCLREPRAESPRLSGSPFKYKSRCSGRGAVQRHAQTRPGTTQNTSN